MLLPKKTKFRKVPPRPPPRPAKGQTAVQFGDFGLKALEAGWITNRQIEAARIAMTRKIKRGGKVWINVFPDKPVTKKPAETRMGSGKGSPEDWVAVIKPGRVMFELAGVPEPLAKEALRLAGQKLPVKTKVVKREADLFEELGAARPDRRRAASGSSPTRGKSCSTCASSRRPARSRTRRASSWRSARSPASSPFVNEREATLERKVDG